MPDMPTPIHEVARILPIGGQVRLWLDDIRLPPAGFLWTRTAERTIALLKTGKVTFASLDHDIQLEPAGADERTGYTVVLWMEENNIWPVDGVRVHSSNPPGRVRMEAAIERHYGRLFRDLPQTANRPPYETFKYPVCKGSFLLGSACTRCEKCAWECEQMFPKEPATAPAENEKWDWGF